MTKNFVISLCLVIASASVAFANSTIYTDDIGRMHFLGKDPGGPTVQQVQNFSNPAQKDLTDIIYKNADSEVQPEETKVNSLEPLQETKEHTNKSKGSFTFNKGAMDASNPYTYGETNITPKAKSSDNSEKKHFWDNW